MSQENKVSDVGFTLIEILVTILIIGTLGVVASSILFSLLRGAAKTETIKEVKQNGDYALSVMEVKIRNSRDVLSSCTGADATSITVKNPDYTTQTTYSCDPGGGVRRIREQVENINPLSVVSTKYLTNTSTSILTDCTASNILFNCTTSPTTGKKSVLIKFSLTQLAQVTVAEGASQTFETRVTLRN